MMPDGYGFLRSSDYNYLASPDDIYLSTSQIRLFGLKTGDTVKGVVRPPKEGEKFFPLVRVLKINGHDPQVVRDRVSFEHLTPIFPQEKFNIADKQASVSTRIIDLFSPIGQQPFNPIVSIASRMVTQIALQHVGAAVVSINGINPVTDIDAVYNGTYPLSRKIYLISRKNLSPDTPENASRFQP